MKTILLPIDFSECSRNAVAYMLNMYRNEPCEFILLHCCHKSIHCWHPQESFQTDLSQEGLKATAENKMQRFLQELRQAYPNNLHKYSGSVEEALLLPAVKRHINTCNLTCIAIGANGGTSDKHTFYGSNTKSLIEEVKNCPLLVIPGNVKFSPIKEIVLPNDFNFKTKPAELHFLKELLQKTKASLIILHIQIKQKLTAVQKKNELLLKELLQDEKPESHLLTEVSVPEGIYSFSESRGSDLLVFINKKKNFLDNLFIEARNDYSGNYFKMPILFIHYLE